MRAAGFAVETEGEASCCGRVRGPESVAPGAWGAVLGAVVSDTGSGEAEKAAAFWVRSLEAFPQGIQAIFSHLSNLLSRAE